MYHFQNSVGCYFLSPCYLHNFHFDNLQELFFSWLHVGNFIRFLADSRCIVLGPQQLFENKIDRRSTDVASASFLKVNSPSLSRKKQNKCGSWRGKVLCFSCIGWKQMERSRCCARRTCDQTQPSHFNGFQILFTMTQK